MPTRAAGLEEILEARDKAGLETRLMMPERDDVAVYATLDRWMMDVEANQPARESHSQYKQII